MAYSAAPASSASMMAFSGSELSQGGEWQSMREITRRAILDDMLRSLNRGAKEAAYRVLVLDQRATRVLGAAVRVFDITDAGIALVESLEKKRQPFPELEAVYVIDPTAVSVDHLCSDFEDAQKARYGRVHVFFLRTVGDEELAKIKSTPALTRRLATLSEVNLNYMAVEENVFHFDRPAALVELYNEGRTYRSACISSMAENLVTLCATLNEYPFVRYDADSPLSVELANTFDQRFKTFINSNSDFTWRGSGANGNQSMRATLIVLDRAADPATPLLHSFVYQALANDVLNVHDGLCRYFKGPVDRYNGQDEDPRLVVEPIPDKDSEIGACLLNEDDPLWVDFRHLHIRQVIENLNADLQTYMGTSVHKMNRSGAEPNGELSVEDLQRAVRELPEYKELIARHGTHLQLVRLCMHKITMRRILDLALLEQTMLTGVTENARELSGSALATEIMSLVRDPTVGHMETARLVGIYMITQAGIREDDRRHILESANPPLPLAVQTMLLNLSYLGVQLSTSTSSRKVKDAARKERIKAAKQLAETTTDARSRHTPLLAEILAKLCNKQLPREDYPYVMDPPVSVDDGIIAPSSSGSMTAGMEEPKSSFGSAFVKAFRATRKTDEPSSTPSPPSPPTPPEGAPLSARTRPKNGGAATARKKEEAESAGLRKAVTEKRNPRGSRVIVFVAGGATHAELAAIHKVMRTFNRDVVVGSTHLLNPESFLHSLKFLEHNRDMAYFTELADFERAKKEAIEARLKKEAARDVEDEDPDAASDGGPRPISPRKRPKSSGGIFGCGCFGN
ncbi:Syntaxin-binding protein 1 [Hondaea fermentalgiana]|uniref:Syntaxin-binding protein 1 n=1 Tax=Hondaea fermentalgiana TaxID=2315210 RepID=A0A2R5GGK0_9STRA|nr:Syntaxin-binding protein 1 [Hondaea fermentalgiana]|eukprot:GBG27783.1 Syntaxin-binding protein 1 [Hondaea fermentalgiana]